VSNDNKVGVSLEEDNISSPTAQEEALLELLTQEVLDGFKRISRYRGKRVKPYERVLQAKQYKLKTLRDNINTEIDTAEFVGYYDGEFLCIDLHNGSGVRVHRDSSEDILNNAKKYLLLYTYSHTYNKLHEELNNAILSSRVQNNRRYARNSRNALKKNKPLPVK
jgi:hypothetical protein